MYDFVSNHGEKCLEVNPGAVELMSDGGDGIIDNFVFFLEAEGFGSIEDVTNIALSFGITVETEHAVELFDVLAGEDGVFGDYILDEEGLFLFLNLLLLIEQHF